LLLDKKNLQRHHAMLARTPLASLDAAVGVKQQQPQSNGKASDEIASSQKSAPVIMNATENEHMESQSGEHPVDAKHNNAAPTQDGRNDIDQQQQEGTGEERYCLCRQPWGNRFMLECDGCQEW
jgi:hypothetical protein